MKNCLLLTGGCVSATVTAMLMAGSVLAQEPPQTARVEDGQGAIEDIVVTAQKRSESVQDVPIAITAVSGAALQERAVGNIIGVASMAPNVSLDPGSGNSGSGSVLTGFIRGIGQNEFSVVQDPGVGIYLDGVYLARTAGANLDLPDIERIEVLKGPQGTLFGRNAVGGAISVVTRTPDTTKFAVQGNLVTGRFDRFDADASVNIPIADTLAMLVTGSTQNRSGYLKRDTYPTSGQYVAETRSFPNHDFSAGSREGGMSRQVLRGKLRWEATPGLRVTLTGDYSHIDESVVPTAVLKTYPADGLAGIYNFCIGTSPEILAAAGFSAVCGPRGTALNPALQLPALAGANVDGNPANDRLPWDNRWVTTDIDRSYATGNSFSRVKNLGFSGMVDFDLSDDVSLRSITGYRHLKFAYGADLDNSPLQIFETSATLTQWQFSQELQLIGKALDNKLNYVLGAYYFYESADEKDYAPLDQGLLQIVSPYSIRTKNYAFFGQLDYRLSDLIGLTAGGRYTHENKSFQSGQSDLNAFNYKIANCVDFTVCPALLGYPDPSDPLRIYVLGWQRQTFSNFSPKLGIQLHPARNSMIYGSWSVGYKTGGWSTRISVPTATAPTYKPEKATTFEVGVKSQLLDRRLQVNLSAFTTDYKGIQLNFQEGPNAILRNAGTARIKGVELELVARPVQPLTITASAGYIHARYTSVEPLSQVPANVEQAGLQVGSPLAKAPAFKLNISPRYEADLGGAGTLIFLVDYTHASSVWNDTERTYLLRRPRTDVFNASVAYRDPSGRYTLTVGGTNITNERYLVNGLNQVGIGLIGGNYNRPAEWYARLGFNF